MSRGWEGYVTTLFCYHHVEARAPALIRGEPRDTNGISRLIYGRHDDTDVTQELIKAPGCSDDAKRYMDMNR